MGMLMRAAQRVRNIAAGAAAGARMSVTPAFDAAGIGRRLSGWTVTGSGINTIVSGSGGSLRNRARDMVRRNAHAASAVDKYVANAVGTGIKPQSRHPDPAAREALHEAWLRFVDEADADGAQNFYGQQALACRALFEAGECFARKRPRRAEDGLAIPLQVQLLEADMVPLDLNRLGTGGNVIRTGIEFDAIGRRTAYHVYRNHPGEGLLFGGDGWDTRAVPASEMMHVFRPLRPGQLRGVTWLHSVLLTIHELDQYSDAELVRKKLSAMMTGFITPKLDDAGGSPLAGTSTADDDTATVIQKLEPGTFPVLQPGETVEFAGTTDLGAGFKDFTTGIMRAIAAGAGVTYEQMTGDLTGVNYSSIRAGMLEFRRACEVVQKNILTHQFCRPVWREFVVAATLAGELPAADVRANLRDYMKVDWIAPGWSWVDPEKEVKAVILAMRAGLMSRSEAVAQLGRNVERVDDEIMRDQERADEKGLAFDSDGRRKSGAGASPSDGGGQQQDQDQDDNSEREAA